MDILQTVIQGGAVGLAAYALFVLNRITGNHITHNTEALSELKEIMAKLHQLISDKIK